MTSKIIKGYLNDYGFCIFKKSISISEQNFLIKYFKLNTIQSHSCDFINNTITDNSKYLILNSDCISSSIDIKRDSKLIFDSYPNLTINGYLNKYGFCVRKSSISVMHQNFLIKYYNLIENIDTDDYNHNFINIDVLKDFQYLVLPITCISSNIIDIDPLLNTSKILFKEYPSLIIKGVINNYGFCVKKTTIDEKIMNFIKKFFNVTPYVKYNSTPESFDVFYEDDIYIVLPKFVVNNQLINVDNILPNINNIKFKTKKCLHKNTKIKFNFIGKLRDYQANIIKIIVELFNNSENEAKGGIIKLSCGGGKTIMGLYLSWLFGLKTLIITHQEFLMDQWIDRIKDFTTARIGIIRQQNIVVDDVDIVVGMLHSISQINYDDAIFKEFGLVIYDEVHHMGSKMFSKTLLKTAAEITIGLSATPERSDKLLKVVNWHVGPILYSMETVYNYRIPVKKIFFRSYDKLFKEKLSWIEGSNKANNTVMMDNLSNLQSRNNLMISIINALKSMGRKVFVLSSRVEHLVILKNGVDKIISDNGEAHIYNTYYYMGKTKKGAKKIAEKDGDIIFATSQLAEEGLDINRLDTILIALPVRKEKSLIQSIGRILRNNELKELTQIPLVIDICDVLSIYQKWSKLRDDFYDKKNCYIQNYHFCEEELIPSGSVKITKKPMNILFDDMLDENFIENNLMIKT